MKKLLLLLALIGITVTGSYARSKDTAREAANPVPVRIYPNPASGIINITYEAQGELQVAVTLTDMSGRATLLKADEVVKKGANTLSYSMAGVPVGNYMLRIQAGTELTTAKVTVVE